MPRKFTVVLGSVVVVGVALFDLPATRGQGPPAAHVVPVAYALGFTPETCALAGLSAAEAADALSRLSAASTLRDQFVTADAALDAAMAAYSEANSNVRRGLVDGGQLTTLSAAESALVEAREDRDTAANLLRAVLAADCDEAERERMDNVAASGGYDVPAEYRVMGYSDEAWQEVAGAVRQRHRVDAGVFSAELADLSALVSLDDDYAVAAARGRLASDLEAIKLSFTGFDAE